MENQGASRRSGMDSFLGWFSLHVSNVCCNALCYVGFCLFATLCTLRCRADATGSADVNIFELEYDIIDRFFSILLCAD